MKYHVYAALIASSTQANQHHLADEINSHMPTEAETAAAEQQVEEWLDDAEDIVESATPAVEARNQRIDRAAHQHEDQAEDTFEEGVEDLEETGEQYENEVMTAQAEFETAVTEQGIKEDWEKLVEEVQSELNGAHIDMKRLRLSAKSLKSRRAHLATNLSVSSEFHDEAPTPEEIEEAEQIIAEWFERGEDIIEDAEPGIQARNRRFQQAWEAAEAEEQKINEELIEELIEAQMEFEDEVMDAEHNFEEELTQNGVIADWEALEDKIERDMQSMKSFNTRVVHLKRRQAVVQRANVKLNMNLARVSEEMARNSPNPAEVDAIKTKVIDWMTRYEDIVDRVTPLEEQRNREIMDATDDTAEDVEDTIEGMFEDWEQNDREFMQEVESAQRDMETELEQNGTVEKVRSLAEEIDHALQNAQQSMIKIRRNMAMRKRVAARAAQSLQQQRRVSDELRDLPDGQEVKEVFDTVTGWVAEAEDIDERAEDAAIRRERALEDAFIDREEEVIEILEDAQQDHQEKEDRFWSNVENAQHDFEVRMDNEGITNRTRELGHDIEDQLDSWGNMKRVRGVTSLARTGDNTNEALRALESEIDSVLATL